MPVFCNLCPTSNKAVVWFKFANSLWKRYKPTTFPFAYQVTDNNNGDWTLKFYSRPTVQQRRWNIRIDWVHSETGNTFRANALLPNTFAYGDNNNPYVNIYLKTGAYLAGQPNCSGTCICDEYWVADFKDKCGNIYTRDLINPFSITAANANTRIHQQNSTCQLNKRPADGGAKTAQTPYLASQVLQTYAPATDTCGDCPSGWEEATGEIIGLGEPQIQITCGADQCPPDTVCQCDNGTSVCCYDASGIPVYTY